MLSIFSCNIVVLECFDDTCSLLQCCADIQICGYQCSKSLHQIRCPQGYLPCILDTCGNMRSHLQVLDLFTAFSNLSQTAHSPKWEVRSVWPVSPPAGPEELPGAIHMVWVMRWAFMWVCSSSSTIHTHVPVNLHFFSLVLCENKPQIHTPKYLCSMLSALLRKREEGRGQHKGHARSVWCLAEAY